MRRLVTWIRLSLLIAISGITVGCSQSGYDAQPGAGLPEGTGGPGAQALSAESLICKADSDCQKGEVCAQNICQVQPCALDQNKYHTVAPMGSRKALAKYQELVMLPTSAPTGPPHVYERHGAQLQPHAMTVPWPAHSAHGGSNVTALVGGDFVGQSPEQMAVAYERDPQVYVQTGSASIAVQVGFSPVALAAGNVTGSGVDTLVALGRQGEVALCTVVPAAHCQPSKLEGVVGKDVAVADIDGDGLEEIIFLVEVEVGGAQQLRVWKANQERFDSGELQQSLQSLRGNEYNFWHDLGTIFRVGYDNTRLHLSSITAGHFGSSSKATIIGLERGTLTPGISWDILDSSRIHRFEITNGSINDSRLTEVGTAQNVDKHASKLIAGDTNGDNQDELLVISDKGAVQVFDADMQTGALKEVPSSSLNSEAHGPVIAAMADMTGDTIVGKLTDGPQLVPGKIIPVAAFIFPPYDAQFSKGPSSISMGNMEGKTEAEGSWIQTHYQGGFVITGLPKLPLAGLGNLNASSLVIAPWGPALLLKHLEAHTQTVGRYYSAPANPAIYGPHYAAVMLSCGCYQTYTYSVDDPLNRLEGAKEGGVKIQTYIPVDGQTVVWTTDRYNALARTLGGLPQINVPVTVGAPDSYPQMPSTLSGQPVTQDNLVYQDKPFEVSPVSTTIWSLTLGKSEDFVKDQGRRILVQAVPSLKGLIGSVGPGYFVENITVRSHQTILQISQSTLFSGTVPPIAENTRAPEDRWADHKYAFTPYLYQEHYIDSVGKDAAFYVLAYSVNRP